jgi:hypothetical protein
MWSRDLASSSSAASTCARNTSSSSTAWFRRVCHHTKRHQDSSLRPHAEWRTRWNKDSTMQAYL